MAVVVAKCIVNIGKPSDLGYLSCMSARVCPRLDTLFWPILPTPEWLLYQVIGWAKWYYVWLSHRWPMPCHRFNFH